MKTIHIDHARAIELLREVVDEVGPDYLARRYDMLTGQHLPSAVKEDMTTCRYADDDGASCIVGRALAKAGLTREELAKLDFSLFGKFEAVKFIVTGVRGDGYGIDDRLPLRLSITKDAARILGTAQNQQDAHRPFGEALAAANTYASVLQ